MGRARTPMGCSWVGLRPDHVITAGGCAVCCVPRVVYKRRAGRAAAISACSPVDEGLYAVAPFLTPSRRVYGHHGVLEAAVPAAALAFAAAAAAPGSAAAAPTGLSHGALHGIQQQRCCNGQRYLRFKHILRFQQSPTT